MRNYSKVAKQGVLICTAIFGLIVSSSVFAEQLEFRKSESPSTIDYFYQWRDLNDEEQTLSFQLDKQQVGNNYRHFKALRPSLLHMHSLRELKKAVAKLDRRQGQVTLLPRVERIEFNLKSMDQDWIAQTSQTLKDVYESSLTSYLKKEHYIEFDDFKPLSEGITFKPDHVRFILENPEPAMPIIKALKSKLPNATPRQMATFILGWIQTIPYDEIEDRATSNGAGFVPPIHLINQNKGDCDSKVTLMAHLMKIMYPNLRMAIIYLPKHALLGMNISYLQEDETIDIEGYSYALVEPVGPAQVKFADAAESSLRHIKSNMYKTELVKPL